MKPPLPIGEEYDFKIIKMNEAEKKIGLSVRALAEDEERLRLEDYQSRPRPPPLTIEEVDESEGRANDEPAGAANSRDVRERDKENDMTKADLIEEVSRVVEMTRKDSEVIVEAIFDSIVRSLRTGDKIEIRGFGSFRTRQRQPRVGRNPKTGDPRGSAAETHPVLQAQQGTEGHGEPAGFDARCGVTESQHLHLMDRLWTPWRYSYISSAGKAAGCIFCEKASSKEDRENLIVHRGQRCYVLLNLFPYNNGHLLIAPYEHVDSLAACSEEGATEMMQLARRSESALRELYQPHGLNLGMNLGEAAGAGVAGHIHLHVLPRWVGDAGFMSTVGETRVIPETLDITWQRVREVFQRGG